jgi:hypothetical protein
MKRRSIHVEQPYLLIALSAKTVDAECSQKACLAGLDEVRSYADRWRILDIPHVFGALRNDLVIQFVRGMLREKPSHEIV